MVSYISWHIVFRVIIIIIIIMINYKPVPCKLIIIFLWLNNCFIIISQAIPLQDIKLDMILKYFKLHLYGSSQYLRWAEFNTT